MKRIASVPSTIICLTISLFTTPSSHAALRQEQPLAEQAVRKVLGATTKVVKQSPFNFDAGVCFGIAVLSRGGFIQTPYPLQRGVRYLFIGGGDINAQDINLAVLDANGKTVAGDSAPDAIPVVFFTPKYTGNYRLTMRLKKSKTTTSFCSIVVMRKTGGYALPVSSIRDAISPSESLPPEADQLANLLRFHRLRNQWAAFGAVLKQGDTTVIPGLKFETGRHVFISGSDGRSTDVDLYLLNGAGQKLAESTRDGNAGAFLHETSGAQTYQLALANRRSQGASLVFLIALDVSPATGAATAPAMSTPGSASSSPSVARGGITVLVNGQRVQFASAGPIEVNGRVMVPLRELFEALGADVEYDSDERTYYVSQDDDELELKVGSPIAKINDQPFRLDAAPMNYNGTTMVPLRFFIQAAGAQVHWNAQQRVVAITTTND
jgi:hypothetical protein